MTSLHASGCRCADCIDRENRAGFASLERTSIAQIAEWKRKADLLDALEPIDMVLHCPACGMQHIDRPDAPEDGADWSNPEIAWTNPPHRSHLCHGCGVIWRPADVPTNGVAAIKTKGKADSKPALLRKAPDGGLIPAWYDAALALHSEPAGDPPAADVWPDYIAGVIEAYLRQGHLPGERRAYSIAAIIRRRMHHAAPAEKKP